MARSSRTPNPSALDGYRRLERTRRAVGTRSTAPAASRRKVSISGRMAGVLRLGSFVAVICVIIATSVGLATAGSRSTDARTFATPVGPQPPAVPTGRAIARTKAAATVHPRTSRHAEAKHAARPASRRAHRRAVKRSKAAAATAPVRTAAAAAPAAPVAAAAPATTRRTLPLTGDVSIDWVLLAGAMLVLLGMLVQIAGQPLPARTASRR